MSFKLVTALRKSGDISAALEMARKDYQMSVDHYSASALFWSLRIVCESSIDKGEFEFAKEIIDEMQGAFNNIRDDKGIAQRCLGMLKLKAAPESKELVQLYRLAKSGDAEGAFSKILNRSDFTSYSAVSKDYAAWIVFYYLKNNIDTISEDGFDEAIELYFAIDNVKPSMVHSQVLNLTIKFAGKHPDYCLLGFIKRWGVSNFRAEDCVRNPDFANGLSLRDRAVRRCFINRRVMLDEVTEVFNECNDLPSSEISGLLSRSYSFVLYKDSVEDNKTAAYFADAQEYIDRVGQSAPLRNPYHSKILESVVWEVKDENLGWFKIFFEKWGFGDSLRDEDWKNQEGKDGMMMPSLAERALRKYAAAVDIHGIGENVERYKALLAYAAERLTDNESVLRHLSKIHYFEGDVKKALETTCELIKTHVVKYYYWSDLAAYIPSSDNDLKAAFYAKAIISCNDEKYLGRIHLSLGRCLLNMRMFGEALCEADKYKVTCERNGWPIRAGYKEIVSAVPIDTLAVKNNYGLYLRLEKEAEEFVYSDLPEHTMVYVGNMIRANKATGKKRQMFVLYDSENARYLINPKACGLKGNVDKYSCYRVRYVIDDKKRKKIVSVRPTSRADVLKYESAVVIRVGEKGSIETVLGDGFKIAMPRSHSFGTAEIGQLVEVAFSKRLINGKPLYNCIDLKLSEKTDSAILNEFKGILKVIKSTSKVFGFVNDIYIGRHLLVGFADGDSVSGRSVSESGRKFAITMAHTVK